MSRGKSEMSFLEHLEELRRRLIYCAVAVLAGMIVCWFFREQIRTFLEAPLWEAWRKVDGLPEPKPLNFAGMLEPFIAYLKLSAVGGIFLASPVVLFQLWRFVSPGLYSRERKYAVPFVLVSTLLFVGGSMMAYSVVFPIGFRFFLEFSVGAEVETLEAEVVSETAAPAEPGGSPPASRTGDGGAGEPEETSGKAEDDSSGDAGPGFGLDGGVDAGPDAGRARDAGPTGTETESDAKGRIEKPGAGRIAPDDGATGSGAGEEAAGKPDAGPAGDAGPPGTERSAESAAWYDWLLTELWRKGCGDLEARDVGAGEVRLRFSWDEEECGPAPEIVRVERDGERIEPGWKDLSGEDGGHLSLEAIDRIGAAGAHSYEVGYAAGEAGGGQLAPVLMIKDYLSFAVRLLLAFGLIFELPILISFLSIAGIVDYKQLIRFSRWFFVIAVLFGAMLTPPDVITQVLLAIPLVVLYFLSVLVAYVFGPKPD
ncbi:MAG: twin-arginine translocase subunit TatC [Polyangia bacterium]